MFQPYYTALMDINVSLPTDCTYTFWYSEPFKPHKVQEVSDFVNGIYSKCMSECVNHSSAIKFNDTSIEVKLALSSSVRSSIPSTCEFILEYSKDNFDARLDETASFVSEIYSKFPTLSEDELNKLKESRLGFLQRDVTVTGEEVIKFKIALKERIVKDMNNERSSLLYVDNAPVKMLKEVAESVFNNYKGFTFEGYFPSKTQTWIVLSKSAITVKMFVTNGFRS